MNKVKLTAQELLDKVDYYISHPEAEEFKETDNVYLVDLYLLAGTVKDGIWYKSEYHKCINKLRDIRKLTKDIN